MGLEQQLEEFKEQFLRTAPAGRTALYEAKIEELRTDFALESVAGMGTQAPEFRLPDVKGDLVSLTNPLRDGPVVVTSHRGGWCPCCNIQCGLPGVLPQMADLGARSWRSHRGFRSSLSTARRRVDRYVLARLYVPRNCAQPRDPTTRRCQESMATGLGTAGASDPCHCAGRADRPRLYRSRLQETP